MTSLLLVCDSVTVNSAGEPSLTAAASAIDATGSEGPGTDASGRLCSFWPSAVHTAPGWSQAAPAASATVTSPVPSGCTVIDQVCVEPSVTAVAPVTVAPAVSSAWSVSAAAVTGSSRSKFSLNVNGLVPSWRPGTRSKYAIGGAVARSPSVVEPAVMVAATSSPSSHRSPSVAHQ